MFIEFSECSLNLTDAYLRQLCVQHGVLLLQVGLLLLLGGPLLRPGRPRLLRGVGGPPLGVAPLHTHGREGPLARAQLPPGAGRGLGVAGGELGLRHAGRALGTRGRIIYRYRTK